MNLKTGKLLCCTTAMLLGPSLLYSAPIAFTGDVPTDFAATPVSQIIADGLDIPMPDGLISGWDINNVYVSYSDTEDLLQIGMDFFGIAGDVDGDGIDGHSADWLIAHNGQDAPYLGGAESISIIFDFDQDLTYDLIAGVPMIVDASGYVVADFIGPDYMQSIGFGPSMPYYDGGHFYAPVTETPDFELSIAHFSELDEKLDDSYCFNFRIVAGAGGGFDNGIGEDIVFGTLCIEDKEVAFAEAPSTIELLQVWPNPFNPTTTVHFSLAETTQASLRVYDLTGREVAVLVDGLTASGEHQVSFSGSDLASGIYLAVLQTETDTQVQRLTLLK